MHARQLAALALPPLLTACLPTLVVDECYTDSECPSPKTCVQRRCELPDAALPPHDAGVLGDGPVDPDSGRDAGPPDTGRLDATPPDTGELCPDGPYGLDHLYFGTPVPENSFQPHPGTGSEPAFDPDPAEGYLSPDGLHFLRSMGGQCPERCYYLYEWVRRSLDEPWLPILIISRVYFWSGHPHLTPDNLILFGCHGLNKCGLYRRATAGDVFPEGDAYAEFLHGPWSGNAYDSAFTPSRDGARIIFASNRVSASADDPIIDDRSAADLWIATASVAGDPAQGYLPLERIPLPSSAVAADIPEWLSDDARTIIFQTKAADAASKDLAITSSTAGAFQAAQRIAILSDPVDDENGFSIPSLSAIAAHGNRAEGYLMRTRFTSGARTYHRFPVCLGAPNP